MSTVVASNVLGDQKIVVIDAGHGGDDPGKIGINNALEKEINGYFKNIDNLSEKEQEEKLLSVKGIGPKVANCILLFGLSRTNRFPIDVWIQRKMQDLYFEGNTKDKETIQKKAEDLFGNYKGYAQQYMFFAGINNII